MYQDPFGNDNDPYAERMFMSDPATAKSRIFVGNIPHGDVSKQDLEDRFNKYGNVSGVTINKGFGFVQFDNEESAAEAVRQEHGTVFRGKRLDVNTARVSDRGRGANRAGDSVDSFRDRSPMDDRSGGRNRDWGRDSRFDSFQPKGLSDPYGAKDGGFGKDSGPGGYNKDPLGYGKDLGGYGKDTGAFGKDNTGFFRGMDRGRDAPAETPGGRFGGDQYGSTFRSAPKDYPAEPVRPGVPKEFPKPFDAPPAAPAEGDRPNDCEIIVCTKKQREYAEVIERRLKKIGLSVDLLFPNEDIPLGRVLANIASRGSLYAVVVMPQNEEHRSLTLNILYGTPQVFEIDQFTRMHGRAKDTSWAFVPYTCTSDSLPKDCFWNDLFRAMHKIKDEHRNMPLEDAVSFIGRNFDLYCRTKGKPPVGPGAPLPSQPLMAPPAQERHPEHIQLLLSAFADNRQLTVLQYDRFIRYLQDRREVQMKVEIGDAKAAAEMAGADPGDEPSGQKQAELQHRILSILNSSGSGPAAPSQGAPAPTGVPPPANWPPQANQGTSPTPLLSDPNVQKALESLIQGDLFRKVSSGAPPPSTTAGNTAPVNSSLGAPPAQPLFGAYASPSGGRRY